MYCSRLSGFKQRTVSILPPLDVGIPYPKGGTLRSERLTKATSVSSEPQLRQAGKSHNEGVEAISTTDGSRKAFERIVCDDEGEKGAERM